MSITIYRSIPSISSTEFPLYSAYRASSSFSFSETSPKILYKLTVLRRGEELQLENDDICESYDLYGFEWIDCNTLSVDGGENTDITLLNTEISDINVLMPENVGKVS